MNNACFLEKVAIITGASAGIGRELALRLAEQGAWLSLAARNAERLEEVADRCRSHGGKAVAVPTDVAEQSQCRNLIERTIAEYSRIDALINNAGISMWTIDNSGCRSTQARAHYDLARQVGHVAKAICAWACRPGYPKSHRKRPIGFAAKSKQDTQSRKKLKNLNIIDISKLNIGIFKGTPVPIIL